MGCHFILHGCESWTIKKAECQRIDAFELLCWGRLRAGGEGDNRGEMAGWHHRLDGHEFEHTLGIGDGQGSLVCCRPWGLKESDTT